MHAEIVVLPGDGIGPEITAAAVDVLKAIATRFGHSLNFVEHDIGGIAIDTYGQPLPPATLEACRKADAVLLGAVGGPKWSDPNAKVRPEQGLLAIRKALGLFANLRPVRTHPAALHASPIKAELLQDVDFVVVRELTGGIYFGDKTRDADSASDLCRYTTVEIERVLRSAFRLAQQRRGKLTSVDKANVLETSRLWRDIAARIGREEFPDVELEHQLVDSMAMHLIAKPRAYDVIVTENMFGDILTDEARCWPARWACCRRPRSANRARSASLSRSMARPRISPARGSPTPTPPFSARPCCCATRWDWRPRRPPSSRRSAPRWMRAISPPTWRHRDRRCPRNGPRRRCLRS